MSSVRVLVTSDYDPASTPPKYVLQRTYLDAVIAAGATPLVGAFGASAAGYLDLAHALIVTGGAFAPDPAQYGEGRRPACGPSNPARTAFEQELLQEALRRGLPVLGICAGLQLLNVVRGGTLVQDLPTEHPGALPHEQTTPKHEPAHVIHCEREGLIATLTGGAEAWVNSSHHQAIKALGRDLQVTARAPDGVIEAVEDPARPFVVGVQWHPERMIRVDWQLGIFRALVAAAKLP